MQATETIEPETLGSYDRHLTELWDNQLRGYHGPVGLKTKWTDLEVSQLAQGPTVLVYDGVIKENEPGWLTIGLIFNDWAAALNPRTDDQRIIRSKGSAMEFLDDLIHGGDGLPGLARMAGHNEVAAYLSDDSRRMEIEEAIYQMVFDKLYDTAKSSWRFRTSNNFPIPEGEYLVPQTTTSIELLELMHRQDPDMQEYREPKEMQCGWSYSNRKMMGIALHKLQDEARHYLA